jgi:UDP-glucose 4-epimerase
MKETYKVLISGGSGFIGGHLRRYFTERGITVVVGADPADQSITFNVNDVSQLFSIKQSIDAVVHLAANTSITDSLMSPWNTYHTNLLGTLNLLEFARKNKIAKFINVSSYVYGQPKYLPIDENHPTDPHSPYNLSKLLAERICESYSLEFKMNIITLRPFYIYGPSPRPRSFVHLILDQLVKEKGNVVLSGESTKRDFLFVDDFSRLIEIILNDFTTKYEVYNVGFGRSFLLSDVARILAELLNKPILIKYDDRMRPGDVTDMIADISKVSKKFDWRPSTGLKKGLDRTLKQYQRERM